MLQFAKGRASWLAMGVGAALLAASTASAATISGSSRGLSWTATSTIVGAGSTATIAGGGNPIYLPDRPRLNGTASLIMDYGGGSLFICTGSLLRDRRSIATAAHCVSDGTSARPISTTAYFYGGPADITVGLNPAATAVSVDGYVVHQDYTGEVIDQNDIAILRLADEAPSFATSYELWEGNDLTGEEFNVAGYGRRSDTGGAVGANLGTNRLRQGDNRYDSALGDAAYGGFFLQSDPFDPDCDADDNFFCGDADIEFSYLSDFDSGLAANDSSCIIAAALGIAPNAQFCQTGVSREVGIAGGDSGGPGFIDGKLASINSYGLTFGAGFGDVDNALNSSFGEFSGYVPVWLHRDFINAQVPEPATWALMIGGFMMTGAALRRRRTVAAKA
jgi:hypothetical protein